MGKILVTILVLQLVASAVYTGQYIEMLALAAFLSIPTLPFFFLKNSNN